MQFAKSLMRVCQIRAACARDCYNSSVYKGYFLSTLGCAARYPSQFLYRVTLGRDGSPAEIPRPVLPFA
jgi:hypothetical protein